MTLDKMTEAQLEKAKSFYDALAPRTLTAAGKTRRTFNLRMIIAEQRRRKIRTPSYS